MIFAYLANYVYRMVGVNWNNSHAYMYLFSVLLLQQSVCSHPVSYRLRIISPHNKREYMDLTWHNMSERFDSVMALKQRIIESFSESFPRLLNSKLGIWRVEDHRKTGLSEAKIFGRCTTHSMMAAKLNFGDLNRIELVDKNVKVRKRVTILQQNGIDKLKKREKFVPNVKKKNSDKYTGPQYTLWAKFIRLGRHDGYDNPPAIPLLTGQQKSKPKRAKENFSDALAGAATAITNVLTGKTKAASSPVASSREPSLGVSPNTQANLRRKHLEDLRMLSQLYDDGVLTHDEFKEQKQNILSGLRKLTTRRQQLYTNKDNNINKTLP